MNKRTGNALASGSGTLLSSDAEASERRRPGSTARRRRAMVWRLVLACFFACTFAGSMAAVAQVSVAISPSSLTTAPNAAEVFTATVTGTSNTAVIWEVNGVQGG